MLDQGDFTSQHESETSEQRQYEHDIILGQYPDHSQLQPRDSRDVAARNEEISSQSTTTTGACTGPSHDGKRASSQFKDKLKALWTNRIKPAFPEAITDINLIRDIITAEAFVARDLHDSNRYPEIQYVAQVRRGSQLCPNEKTYLSHRRMRVHAAFAKYMGLDPAEVHPDDVPTVGFGGSGGGYRAMLSMLGYALEMKRAGLWDVFKYVAGVSGSCWAIAAYYTFAEASIEHVIRHCKERLSPHHPLSNEAIRMTLTAPGGAYNTIGPLVQKRHSHLSIVLMDLYSVFTTGYLFLHPTSEPSVDQDQMKASERREWFKWSSAQKWLQEGAEPLPIMTAIRHERPWKDWVDKEHPFRTEDPLSTEHSESRDAWFQWFEMTPFEVGCDELQAWVPTWGFGRPFELGNSTMQLPEQSLSLLLGLSTSAPAGPLNSYLATIKRNLPSGSIGEAIHELGQKFARFRGQQKTNVFQQHHPLHACNEHNFMYHLTPVPSGQPRPPGIENSPRIHLIDSGLDNNCPTYVLLRPERECDVILNMDASSDVQNDTFQERVDQIGSRRGLRFTRRHNSQPDPDTQNPDRFKGLYAQIYDGLPCERPGIVVDSYGHRVQNPPAATCHRENTMVYLPLLPNERVVPGFDPSAAKFSGSYNLVWTAEQVEMLIKLSAGNFRDGQDTIKEALVDAYQRNKRRREQRAQ